MLRRGVGVAVLVAAAVAMSGLALAQTKPAAAGEQAKTAGLPSGEAIMTKYVEALGGSALDKINNRVMEGTLDLGAAAMGIKLSIAAYSARPDRSYTLADSEQTGRIETGVVDGVAWENSGMRGAIVKEGAEKDDAMRDAQFDRLVRWKENSKTVECVGVAEVDGKSAYKVVITPKTGSAQTLYIDRESSLPVQIETRLTTQGQTLDLVTKPGDYRAVDGIKIPFTIRQFVMGQERVMTVDKVRHNVDLPADRFALPPAIKAIVDKK